MKVQIKNLSKKSRSEKLKKELKNFTILMAQELNIQNDIKLISLEFRNDWKGYYPKGKPLGGFSYLLKNGKIKITLTKFWDINLKSRKEAIVHELTHVQQLLRKKLVIIKDRDLLWKGRAYNKWKKFRIAKLESKKTQLQRRKYLTSHFPWEKEVQNNIKKYLKFTPYT